MSDRARILASLGTGTPSQRIEFSASASKSGSFEEFAERLRSLGGALAAPEDLASLAGRAAWVDDDAEPYVAGIELRRVREIWDAEIGFTLADWAIAESGSILLSAGPGRRRLGSLAPELHVCFLPRANLLGTLEEALPRLTERTSVLITGASRTADIEGVLVRGVHGPKEVWVVPV